MNILQIFPGKVWGGAEQYVLDLSHALTERGHNVVMACRAGGVVAKRLSESGESFVEVSFGSLCEKETAKEIASLINLHKIDVIHIHDKKFVKCVVKATNLAEFSSRVVLTRHIARDSKVPFFARKCWKGVSRIIFVSELSKELWCGANKWFPASKCIKVLNSVAPVKEITTDERMKLESEVRTRFGIKESTPLLIFTGRVRKSKGCEVIVKALSMIAKGRDFAMIFVGAAKPSDYDKKLKKLATDLGIGHRVHFYGFTRDASLISGLAYVGVQPSIVREACPLSPMEFMQQGVPVIATTNGAQREYIVNGETGMLVEPGSVNALAETLAAVLDDPIGVSEMGKCAKGYFTQNMSYNHFVDNILNVYQDACNED